MIRDTDHPLNVSSITANGGSWTLSVDNTYYLTISKTIEIDGLKYKIIEFVLNESITIKALGHSTAPTATSFTIDSPIFKHGTAKMVNAEHGKIDARKEQKYPFIWLVEIQETQNKGDKNSRLDAVMPLNLMFFTDNDKKKWLIEDHYTNAIYPMLNEIEYFIAMLRTKRTYFNDDFDYTTTNHVNFGEYLLNKGNQTNIISDDISGVQLRIDLEFVKRKCTTDLDPICRSAKIFVNSEFLTTVKSGGTTNIEIIDLNGNPVEFDIIDGKIVIDNAPIETFDIYLNGYLMLSNVPVGDNIYLNSSLMLQL